MGRWEPDAAGRLREAAIELFLERGYDLTTVSDIAERAGVTSRTFFRYYPDKRGVLFGGTEALETAMTRAVAAAPPEAGAMDAVGAALEAAAEVLSGNRAYASKRQAIISTHDDLQERELVKMAGLAHVLAGALQSRGVPETAARLAAETGIAVFRVGFDRWVTGIGRGSLPGVIRVVFGELRALSA